MQNCVNKLTFLENGVTTTGYVWCLLARSCIFRSYRKSVTRIQSIFKKANLIQGFQERIWSFSKNFTVVITLYNNNYYVNIIIADLYLKYSLANV